MVVTHEYLWEERGHVSVEVVFAFLQVGWHCVRVSVCRICDARVISLIEFESALQIIVASVRLHPRSCNILD